MKNYFLLICMFLPSILAAQESNTKKKINLSVGYVIHSHFFNEDDYMYDKISDGISNVALTGFDLRINIPSKWDNLDFLFGTIVERNNDLDLTSTSDHTLNGGGVYAGISPKTRGKNFGVTSMFAVGVLSYKDYYSYYRDNPLPVIDIYEKKASFGLGAMSSVGFYLKAGPVGINPQVNAVFSGGHEASFLFYGVVLPLTVQF